MTMLNNNPEAQIRRTRKNIRIDDAILDIVESFYPRPDFMQVLPLHMQLEDIMNIMNCNEEEALTLLRESREYYGDPELRLLVPHFCDYMKIDELWVYLFLTSLRKPSKPQAQSETSITYTGRSYLTGEPLLTLAQAIENIRNGLTPSKETLRERGRIWLLKNPLGEAMAKRFGNYRVVIYPDEIASIIKVSLETAQKMLRDLRRDQGMRPKSRVSIKRFCDQYYYEEADIRKALAIMYGEEENEK